MTIHIARCFQGFLRGQIQKQDAAGCSGKRALEEEEVAYYNLLFLARFSKTPRTSSEVIGRDVPTDCCMHISNI